MTLVLILGVVGVALFAMLVVIPPLVHRSLAPALRARVAASYPESALVLEDLRAVTFGLESKGVTQARGNGALVLTDRELHFFQFLPARDLRIPCESIVEVKTTRSHLGKSIGRDLLFVAFEVDGRRDSVAWYVTDVAAWVGRLG